MNHTVQAILGLVRLFFANNPTVDEIDTVLPPITNAIAAAKAGQPFSVNFPMSVDGVAGTASFSWSPKQA